MARPALVAASTLVEDLDFYPRASVDATHVADIVRAMEAGIKLPPVVADRESKRLADGWHRRRAALKLLGPTAEIEVFWQDYANDAELYEDAVQRNADHGRKLTTYDHVRIAIRSRELGMPPTRIAAILHRTEAYVDHISVRVAQTTDGETIALKRPMVRLAGTTLTPQQESMNRRSSGWSVGYHAQQLIGHLEANTIELTPELIATLVQLRELLFGLDLDQYITTEGE